MRILRHWKFTCLPLLHTYNKVMERGFISSVLGLGSLGTLE